MAKTTMYYKVMLESDFDTGTVLSSELPLDVYSRPQLYFNVPDLPDDIMQKSGSAGFYVGMERTIPYEMGIGGQPYIAVYFEEKRQGESEYSGYSSSDERQLLSSILRIESLGISIPRGSSYDANSELRAKLIVGNGVSSPVIIATDKHPESKFRPYLLIGYQVGIPTVSSLTPNRDTEKLSARVPILLEWNHNSSEGGIQEGFVLEYSTDNWATTETVEETTDRQSYEFPALFFDDDITVNWRVKTIDSVYHNESDFIATYFLISGIKPYVTNVVPNRAVMVTGNPITLQWVHNSEVGGIQESFTLEYSTDGWTTTETVEETTDRQSYEFPALFFDGGTTVNWRVKTIDSVYHNESEFVSARFTTSNIKPYVGGPITPTYGRQLSPMEDIKLTWKHNSQVGGVQEGFILEYSINNWVDVIRVEETTDRQSYTFPSQTFEGDTNIRWKIKTVDSIYHNESDFETSLFATISTKPYLRGLTPNNSLVDTRNPITLQWVHNSTINGIQEGFVLEYSTDNWETTETIEEITSTQSHTFIGNFFDGGTTVNWRVKTIDSILHNESDFANASFTTGITAQIAPNILAPFGEYLDVADEINFEWIFMGHPGEFQSKYEINWSRNGGATWFEIINESNNSYHVALANAFTTGTITWRIRTWNNYNEISPWSETKSFYLIGRPATPVITEITNYSKPTVAWTSDDQQIYELEILQNDNVIYSSGRIASVSTFNHYVDMYLANGTYKARLRVKNRYDLWGDYGERNFIIERDNPPTPNIEVISGEYKVTIKGTELSDKTYVYRDNHLLGEMINGVYEDYTGENNKEYNYYVRTINEEENFSDSNIKAGNCSFRGNTLALERKPSDFLLLRFNLSNKPKKSIDFRVDGSEMKFDGREYTTFEFDNSISLDKSLRFNVGDEPFKKLQQLINDKSILIYRDHFGENIYGVVKRVIAEKSVLGYVVDFTINKVKEV